MTGRILVVDDVRANVRLLEARLSAEYFDVRSAASGAEALSVIASWPCDIVLLDVMMPGMDGFEVCRRIKSDPRTAHIPVVMITALDRTDDRIRGLRVGADEFLTKPVNDLALVARVKNLVSLKRVTDELRLRAQTGSQFGLVPEDGPSPDAEGRVLLVDDCASSSRTLFDILRQDCRVERESDGAQALITAAERGYETIVVNLGLKRYDALRLVSQVRALERTRLVPIILIADADDSARMMRALELGVNDCILRPVERTELVLRLRTQIARKRANDRLASDVEQTIAMATTDPLTGLRNRHYLKSHLARLVRQAGETELPLSVLMIDIDRFKSINDTHGHDAGDAVLKEVAGRLRANVRGLDMACRLGGEEFVILMPETTLSAAEKVAERLRDVVAGAPFALPEGEGWDLPVTVSVGVATHAKAGDSGEKLIKRADRALYRAKEEGRNRVVCCAESRVGPDTEDTTPRAPSHAGKRARAG
ncbi:PleD family two-component system response regulator [Stappia sp. ES.058]|uniref:PleD family two-component system response regulator n=1 Tax=Stappia sp. ES.058 TaxID=1881061 RepID=UPI00087CDE80|nr:PleD family two-component system response regulator [Stappia sp. ES.058]SDU19695.1 response regulator receiver modulated diguanylate cyclase [Stappia sp. ES.058]